MLNVHLTYKKQPFTLYVIHISPTYGHGLDVLNETYYVKRMKVFQT